jgi:hypothetical protein
MEPREPDVLSITIRLRLAATKECVTKSCGRPRQNKLGIIHARHESVIHACLKTTASTHLKHAPEEFESAEVTNWAEFELVLQGLQLPMQVLHKENGPHREVEFIKLNGESHQYVHLQRWSTF